MTLFRLAAPLAGFRPYEARDYQETLPLPPHSTVFGAMLSLVGAQREASDSYFGTRLGIAGDAGARSVILRKMRRDPANPKKGQPRVPAFRPEYQELLSDVVLWAWVEQGDAKRDLATELVNALRQPQLIRRDGVVSLGESSFMLDSITACTAAPDNAIVLRPRQDGSLSLTVWVDFIDRTRTRVVRFEPIRGQLSENDAVSVGP